MTQSNKRLLKLVKHLQRSKDNLIFNSNVNNENDTTETDYIIQKLKLLKHPEGGFYLTTYKSGCKDAMKSAGETDLSGLTVKLPNNKIRNLMSSIFWLQRESDSKIMLLHKIGCDIVHYFHKGNGLKYYIVNPIKGTINTYILGPNLLKHHKYQLIVHKNNWIAAELILDNNNNNNDKEQYTLVSEACCPGFDFNDWKLINNIDISNSNLNQKNQNILQKFIVNKKT